MFWNQFLKRKWIITISHLSRKINRLPESKLQITAEEMFEKKKKNSNMLDKSSCFSVCYQILLRPLIEWKIVVLRGLPTDFFE